MGNQKKQTCYNCAYKGTIPGSCHSRCNYDWNKSMHNPPAANEHGKKNGWYMFPYNFDPVWQTEECKAHSTEADKDMVNDKSNPFADLMSILGKRMM